MRIGLVSDVPQDLVARGVEQAVDRDGELARAEVGPEMAADLTDRVDDQLADVLRHALQLDVRQRVKILRVVDAVEQHRLAAGE